MYEKSARFYDAVYSFKDYAGEVARLRTLITEHGPSEAKTLLDVACGTGQHMTYLKQWYDVAGLELNPEFVTIASERHPDVPIHQGDMRSFDLGQSFDVVVCLFSAIGYVQSVAELTQAVGTMAHHLSPGGVLIIESWFTPEQWQPGRLSSHFVDDPDLRIARMVVSEQQGNVAVMDMHHLVGTPEGIHHFVETHEMTLFTRDEYLAAFAAAGLETFIDEQGLIGRALYIGVNPATD